MSLNQQVDEGRDDLTFEELVEGELARLRVRREARHRLAVEAQPNRYADVSYADHAALSAEPAELSWRLDGLLMESGTALIVAERKTGKTTFIANLVHAMVTGEPFLGEFAVRPPGGTVVVWDTEMPQQLLRRWYTDLGLLDRTGWRLATLRGDAGRLDLLDDRTGWRLATLRGDAGRLDLLDDRIRDARAKELADLGASVLILDPLGPVLRSLGIAENDNTEVGRYFDALNTLRNDAGLSEVFATHHAGHSEKGRARGASVFGDTPDLLVALTRPRKRRSGSAEDGIDLLAELDDEDDRGPRQFAALGRGDVEIGRRELAMDATTRLLRLTGPADRRAARTARLAGDVDTLAAAVRKHPGMGRGELRLHLSWRAEWVETVATEAERRKRIRTVAEGQKIAHYPAEGTS